MQNGHRPETGKPKVVDLFSGAGGLSCGLEMAGFETIASVEQERVYAETFAKNHPHAQVFVEDIRELSRKNLPALLGVKKGELE